VVRAGSEHLGRIMRRDPGTVGQAKLRGVEVGLFGLTKSSRLRQPSRLGSGGQARRGWHRRHRHTPSRLGSSRPRCSRHVPGESPRRDQGEDPVGRLGRPDEIARAVHFLVSLISRRSSPGDFASGQRRDGHVMDDGESSSAVRTPVGSFVGQSRMCRPSSWGRWRFARRSSGWDWPVRTSTR